MSGGRNSEASAVVALALAFQRSPARHAELMRGGASLPPSVGVLLRLAGGTPPQEMDPELASLASPGELRDAALFFIEQVLFQRDADHYRLLGLSQDAAPGQVKEHHRLLMRLFHPDRENHADERREQFATRANLAYNMLRDADSRARYDETLKLPQLARVQAPQRAPVMAWRQAHQPESFWSVRVYPLLMRHLPQWVLAGTALVSVTVVGAVYLFNPPMHLQQYASASSTAEIVAKPAVPETESQARVETAAANATPLDEAAAQFERRIAAARQAANAAAKLATAPPIQQPAKSSLRVAEAALPKPVSASQARQQPAPVAPVRSANAVPVKVVEKLAVVAPAASSVGVQKPAPEDLRPAGQPAAVPQPAAEPARPSVAAVVSAPPPAGEPPAPSPRPALPDPSTLLARFLEAYEKGDIQTCMALLDDGMRAKPELRREYDALFRSTDLRHIKILNMNWSREGDFIRGEGQYRSTMMHKGENLLRNQGGQIRVELIRRGGTALINELHYIANNRS